MYMDAEEKKKELMEQNRVSDGMMFKLDCPVAYGLQLVPERWMTLYMLNPMSTIIATFRYAVFGFGYYNYIKHAGSIMDDQRNRFNLGRMIELIKVVEKYLDSQKEFSYLRAKFPLLFEKIFANPLCLAKEIVGNNNVSAIRAAIYSDVQDVEYFRNQAIALLSYRDDLREEYGSLHSMDLLAEYQYYLGGYILIFKIRHFLFRALRKITSWGGVTGQLLTIIYTF